MAWSLPQLRLLALAVGFPDPDTAAAVAMAESGGNPGAYGDADYGGSVGLWQVNLPSHPQYDATALTDPWYNARAALAISNGGTNWQPWTTYRTGAYRPYMPAVSTWVWVGSGAVAAVAAGAVAWSLAMQRGVPARRKMTLGQRFDEGMRTIDKRLSSVGL